MRKGLEFIVFELIEKLAGLFRDNDQLKTNS